MKRLILSILVITSVLTMAAQEKNTVKTNDTIVVNTPDQVVVTRAKNGAIGVSVKGKEGNSRYRLKYRTEVEERDTTAWNLNLPFLKPSKSEWKMMPALSGCYFAGLVNSGEPAGSGLHGGFGFGFTHLVGARYNFADSGFGFSTGLGFGGQIHAVHDGTKRFGKTNGALTLEPLPDGVSKSDFNITRLQFHLPVQFCQRIGKNFGITAGAMLNYNFSTSASTFYNVGSQKIEENIKGLKIRPLTVDFTASLGWKDFSLFFKYSPQGIFRDGFGPQFSTFSIGIRTINF